MIERLLGDGEVLGADSESGPGGGKYRVPDVNQSSSTRTLGKSF